LQVKAASAAEVLPAEFFSQAPNPLPETLTPNRLKIKIEIVV
jgi:hypothetical protein